MIMHHLGVILRVLGGVPVARKGAGAGPPHEPRLLKRHPRNSEPLVVILPRKGCPIRPRTTHHAPKLIGHEGHGVTRGCLMGHHDPPRSGDPKHGGGGRGLGGRLGLFPGPRLAFRGSRSRLLDGGNLLLLQLLLHARFLVVL